MTAEHLEAGVALGDFQIEKRIGSGGMGIVYKARSTTLDRPVALKVLGPRMDDSTATARYRREAQAVAKLQHPGIAAVHFVGQDKSVCYMAMEYIEGHTLHEIIAQLRVGDAADSIDGIATEGSTVEDQDQPPERFDVPTTIDSTSDNAADGNGLSAAAKTIINSEAHVRRCCEIVRDATLALSHAHDRQVVHRDIKPGNLMLDINGRVCVIDFGLARFYEDATLTYTGQLVGTPIYMSPEQVTGRITIDHRSDIYSLGLVLYQLLSLEPPINAENREQAFRAIITKEMRPLSWKNNTVSRDLEAVVHTAIAKDPDQRYQTAEDFTEDLNRVLAGESVKAEAYQFGRDETEIDVARPPGVVNIGMVLIALGCMVFAVPLGMLLVCVYQWSYIGSTEPWILRLAPSFGGAVFLGAALWTTGKGIISARRWARPACVGITVMGELAVIIFSVAAIWEAPSALPIFLCVLLMSLTLGGAFYVVRILMSRRTEKWLMLASEHRAEFKRLRDTAA
ncbi:MAG: serine/threonine-protein kinase [Fuerstiella sp.]